MQWSQYRCLFISISKDQYNEIGTNIKKGVDGKGRVKQSYDIQEAGKHRMLEVLRGKVAIKRPGPKKSGLFIVFFIAPFASLRD